MDDRRKKRERQRSTSVDRDDNHRRKKGRVPPSTKVGASRVVHIRNISSGVEETDVIQLGLPFGRVSNILMLKMKSQAFLEFERESSARTMVDYFQNSSPPMICGRTVFVQFSEHRELKTTASHSNANAKTQAALKAARSILDSRETQKQEYSSAVNTGRILHLTVENLIYPVTLKTLTLIFQKYGRLKKIFTFTENNLFQALIEYDRARDAEEARHALHGQNVYNGCCNLQIHKSKLSSVQVRQNDDAGWDFTKANQPSSFDYMDHASLSRDLGASLSRDLGVSLSRDLGTSLPRDLGDRLSANPVGRFERSSRLRDPADKRAPLLDRPITDARDSDSFGAEFGDQSGSSYSSSYSSTSNGRSRKPDRPIYQPPKGKFHENLATDFHKPSSKLLLRGILKAHKKVKAKESTEIKPKGEKGSVVLVSNLDKMETTPDKLFTLFGVYGDVVRVKILFNKKDNALIQFADASMADTARQHLDKAVVFGRTIGVRTSKHSSVAMPKDDFLPENLHLTKDFSNSPLHRYKKAGSKNCGNIFKPGSTLHLSNISDGVTQEELVKPFKKYGKVVRIKFLPGTQKMAVLAMSSIEEAIDALIHLHNHPFRNNHLRVSFSKSPLKP